MIMDHKLVVAVRTDLKMSKGKLAVQVAHAAVICALAARRHHRRIFRKWYDEGQKKVVVKIKGEKELFLLKADAEASGLQTGLVRDAGLTELKPGTITCLGIGPGRNEKVDDVTGEYPLL